MIQAFVKKQEKSQVNNLTYHLKQLGKEQTKSKVSRSMETKYQGGNKQNNFLKDMAKPIQYCKVKK